MGDLPEGWEEHHDASSGQVYYIRTATGEAVWELPTGETDSAAPASGDGVSGGEWEERHDEASGAVFYVHAENHETVWELPPGATVRHAAAAAPHEAHDAAAQHGSSTAAWEWEGHHDTSSGQAFYIEVATGEAAWTLPEGVDPHAVRWANAAEDSAAGASLAHPTEAAPHDHGAHDAHAQHAAAATAAVEEDAKEAGHEARVRAHDHKSGRAYFVHRQTGEATWELPSWPTAAAEDGTDDAG